MSKTAILLSGHMRNFDVCLPTMHWHVFRHYPDSEFYVSTIDDKDAHKVQLLRDRYGDRVKAVEVVDKQPDCVAEIAGLMDIAPEKLLNYAAHAPYAISVPVQAILAQLWQLQRLSSMLLEGEGESEIFIRCRPDLFFHSFSPPETYCLAHPRAGVYTPWWGRFGGINDRFAVMSLLASVTYLATYSHTPALLRAGCPLHPESLIAARLQEADCQMMPTLRAEFSKVDDAGNLVRPWLHEVLPNDAANLV